MPFDPPSVSVLMLAHNHALYIEQAIESIAKQECQFNYELIIGEDCSGDHTRAICRKMKSKYSDLITLIEHDANVGMHENFEILWQSAKSELIAFCEGDDFWKSSSKLEKQFNYFAENPNSSLCGGITEVMEKDESGEWNVIRVIKPDQEKKIYRIEDLVAAYNFHFSSIMVKKCKVKFPDWFQTIYCVDRPLYLLATENSYAGVINEIVSVYRIHPKGNWSAISLEKKAVASSKLFVLMADYFDESLKPLFYKTLSNILWSYMSEAMNAKDHHLARKLFYNAVRISPFWTAGRSIRLLVSVALRTHIPVLFR